MKINFFLTGYPKIFIDGAPVQFPTKKAEGIFYYLIINNAAHPGNP